MRENAETAVSHLIEKSQAFPNCLPPMLTKYPPVLSSQAAASIIMDGLKACGVLAGLLVALISGTHKSYSLHISLLLKNPSNASNPLFQSPPDSRHQLLCPTKKTSPCSSCPRSTSAAPGNETWFGPNRSQKTASSSRGTTRPLCSFTTRRWRTPATTPACTRAGRRSRKRKPRRWYMCLCQVSANPETS